MDLNHDLLSQSQVCFHYTNPEYGDPCGIRTLHCCLERAVTWPVSRRDLVSSVARAGYLLCGDSELLFNLKNQNIIDLHSEYGCENYKIIYSRQCCSTLPLVDGLRRAEAEDVLEILHRQARVNPQASNIVSGCGHINDRNTIHFIYAPVPALSRKDADLVGLFEIDGVQNFDDFVDIFIQDEEV